MKLHSPSSKSEYFALSQQLGTPLRCPLLDRCERRAHTIALANDWPLSDAPNRVGLKEPLVRSVGERAYKIGGTSNFVTGGLCPEVNLFEGTMALIGLSGKPTTKGQYDKYMAPQIPVLETGHFSACAEYISSTQTKSTDDAPDSIDDKQASGNKMAVEPPQKLTLKWLYEHAPWSFYVWFFGAMSLAFSLGYATSEYRISMPDGNAGTNRSSRNSAQEGQLPAPAASNPSAKLPPAK